MTTSTETLRADLAAAQSQQWEFEPQSGVHHLRIGDLKLSVKRGLLGINADYTVRHEHYGVLRLCHPADSLHDAKQQALAYCQAWVNETMDA